MYVLITGGFDPIHSGHLNAFASAASLGNLVVGLNSDRWLINKKGAFLLPYREREVVVKNLRTVFDVLSPWDDTDGSACAAIQKFHNRYASEKVPLAFVNGGDRTPTGVNEQEFALCTSLGITSIFGMGGGKTASSSNFLADYLSAISKK